ncbi:MAG: hypothetical protein PHT69_07770 [Bacteroidales bacterium]|nr:hypothetical protein [Bacteroidales bacterium]
MKNLKKIFLKKYFKNKTIHIIFLIYFLIIVSCLFCVLQVKNYYEIDPKGNLNLLLGLISVATSIFTLIIAYYLFDKFGLKSQYKQKQLDSIIKLYDKIFGFKLIMSSSDKILIYFPLISNNPSKKQEYNRLKNEKLYFSIDYYKYIKDYLDISEFNTPSNIKKKLEEIMLPDRNKGYEKIQDGLIINIKGNQSEQKYFYLVDAWETLEKYDALWCELINMVKSWLADNNINLNK